MGWSIDTYRMKNIRSFEEAEAYFSATEKPMSGGWSEFDRPLDGKRMLHKALHKASANEYTCRLYDKDMVTYHRDGSVGVSFHHSLSSRKFLHEVLPKNVRCFPFNRYSWLSVNTPEGEIYFCTDHVCLSPVGTKWSVNYNQLESRARATFNRRKGAAVRKKVIPFVKFLQASHVLTVAPKHSATFLDLTNITEKLVVTEELKPEEFGKYLQFRYPEVILNHALNRYAYDIKTVPFTEPPKRSVLGNYS